MTPEQLKLRSQIAGTVKNNPNNKSKADDLRRQLRESRLAEHIRKTVDAAPPLTADQRDRLALILRGDAE